MTSRIRRHLKQPASARDRLDEWIEKTLLDEFGPSIADKLYFQRLRECVAQRFPFAEKTPRASGS